MPPPVSMILALGGMTAGYLMLTQVMKTWFYRRFAPERGGADAWAASAAPARAVSCIRSGPA
ncbi:MAG: hypothetical protein AAAB35_12565 [Phyllobacterium sp.]|uniref:hypothetical protein n=1 Tax=Phyllobacterium sp. TaxID=1871046 RepID=UPI0030EFF354